MGSNRSISFSTVAVLLATLLLTTFALAQQPTGSIQGTITDPSGAVVSSAKVTIKGVETGQELNLTTSSRGTYTSGPLLPGAYLVSVTASGFGTTQSTVRVEVGGITAGNFGLRLGKASEIVSVESSAVQVNTEQASVSGVLNAAQIETIPFSGRNFLDLATFEPGVQIQDGGVFDPTKNGFSSISFGGRFGRTARITLDGIDVSDETVGTTTQNIPAGGIQEFQISQSLLDISTELTSSGAVNVVTKSGTNILHGQGFGLFRDRNAGIAAFPGGQTGYYQRNQFGGQLGGAIIKDKLFFFGTAEHVRNPLIVPLTPETQFLGVIPSGYPAGFKETTSLGRLDWQIKPNMRLFYRFTYNYNADVRAFGGTYQVFANRDNTPAHGLGWDYSSGNFTHSIRFGYLKFQNHIADAVLGNAGVFDPAGNIPVAIRIGGASVTARFGPSRLAPQATFQSNKEIKYDGTKVQGSHILRFGVAYNKILGGGFASFYGIAPELRTSNNAAAQVLAAAGPFSGGSGNPLNYVVTGFSRGNGLGFFTEVPQFGFPAGGQYDSRLGVYFGDSWKFSRKLTLTMGLRYDRDTGRSDSDTSEMTCDQIDVAAFTVGGVSYAPCSGKQRILDQVGPGLGAIPRQPNANFGPQVGFAYDLTGSGKTVIRGGVGLYFENGVFNNILFDRPPRLAQGLFFGQSLSCPATICGHRVGDVLAAAVASQAAFQAAAIAGGPATNTGFLGETLAVGNNSTGNGFFNPNYRTPRSIQMNLGVQRELKPGIVLSADFIRNVGEHYLIGVDMNHNGDARFLNKTAALHAISVTNAGFGCAGTTAAATNCAIAAGATIADYAGNGLTAGNDPNFFSGFPAAANGATPDTGAAFPGINPLMGEVLMENSIGRSTYTGVQVKVTARKENLLPGIHHSNWTVSWAGSRFNTMAFGGDQDFLPYAWDVNQPTRYYGPGALDRTFQLSVGGYFQIGHRGPAISFGAHFNSPLASSLYMENQSRPGEIFQTDLTGDGETGDPITGFKLGTFGRGTDGGNINKVIGDFNSANAGKLTPAGQALVNAGVLTTAQMIALGGVIDTVPLAPTSQFSNPWFKAFDAKLSWPIKLRERWTLEPSIAFFNAFNFANFARTTGALTGSAGAPNGTAAVDKETLRIGVGTGLNTSGASRQTEFGLKLTF